MGKINKKQMVCEALNSGITDCHDIVQRVKEKYGIKIELQTARTYISAMKKDGSITKKENNDIDNAPKAYQKSDTIINNLVSKENTANTVKSKSIDEKIKDVEDNNPFKKFFQSHNFEGQKSATVSSKEKTTPKELSVGVSQKTSTELNNRQSVIEFKRGDIVKIINRRDRKVPGVQDFERYGVITQNDCGNENAPSVILALLTGVIKKEGQPTHVVIEDLIDTGLEKTTMILCEQIQTLNKCFIEKVGILGEKYIERLDMALIVNHGLKERVEMITDKAVKDALSNSKNNDSNISHVEYAEAQRKRLMKEFYEELEKQKNSMQKEINGIQNEKDFIEAYLEQSQRDVSALQNEIAELKEKLKDNHSYTINSSALTDSLRITEITGATAVFALKDDNIDITPNIGHSTYGFKGITEKDATTFVKELNSVKEFLNWKE